MGSDILTGTGGVLTNVSDYVRGNTQLKVGNNINMVKRGILTNKFSGWTRQRAGVFNAGAAFREFAVFTDGTGSRTLCFQVGDKLYSYDGAVETSMDGTALDTTRPPCIRMFAPYNSGSPIMVLCNGINQPRKYTGTGAAVGAPLQLDNGTGAANYPVATVAPLPVRSYSKPKFCEPFLDRMVLTGFDVTTTQFDVLFTNSGTLEKCTQAATPAATDGGAFQVNPALGPITALKAFKLSNDTNDQVLLIGQANGVSVITGKDATNFKMFTLTAEYGIPSNRALIQMQNDLWFLASDGLRKFSQLAANANLINSSLTFPVQDIINRINPGAVQFAHIAHMRKYQELVLWLPLDADTTCKNALVFNYNNEDSTQEQITPIIFTKDGTSVGASIIHNNVYYGGGYDGLLQLHYSGNLYDALPVQWEIFMSMIKPDQFEQTLSLEKVVHITEGGFQKFLCNAYLYNKIGNTLLRTIADPNNFEITADPSGGTILDAWRLGVDAFPDSGVTYHDATPQAVGVLAELQLRGTQQDHVIEWVGTYYRTKSGGLNA